MEQAHQYIKRLLVFAICVFLFFLSANIVPAYIALPVLMLVFSLLHARITGDKPPHLFAYYRTDNYFKKGGLRDLIRIFVTLFGFVYDTAIWTVWGVYLIFILFIDLLDFLKTIFYWLIHAILWFLRQYVPFIILLYKLFIHYIIRWPWWLYQISYFNVRYAFNKNSFRIALTGTLLASIIIFIFYFLELMLIKIPGITFIGAIISLLPLAWSFGEIAAMRVNKQEDEAYSNVRLKFQNGIEAVRSILFYVTLFVVLLLAQLGLNLLGWIPNIGVPISGFVFNINTLISLILFFVSILIALGVVVLPSYRLYANFSEIKLKDSIDLIKTIFRKILQYFVISLPNSFFSIIIIIIPLVIVMLAAITTYKLKNFTVDLRIENLRTRQANTDDSLEAYLLGMKVEHLEYLKVFPMNLSHDLEQREYLTTKIPIDEEDLRSDHEEVLKTIEDSKERIASIKREMDERTSRNSEDPLIADLKIQRSNFQTHLNAYEAETQLELSKLQADIDLLAQRKKQIPYMFFFGGLWLVIFGSLVIAFITSYLGNIFHQVFIFRNDDSPSEWMNIIRNIRTNDPKQPLLGGTLFFVSAFVLYLIIKGSISIDGITAVLNGFRVF